MRLIVVLAAILGAGIFAASSLGVIASPIPAAWRAPVGAAPALAPAPVVDPTSVVPHFGSARATFSRMPTGSGLGEKLHPMSLDEWAASQPPTAAAEVPAAEPLAPTRVARAPTPGYAPPFSSGYAVEGSEKVFIGREPGYRHAELEQLERNRAVLHTAPRGCPSNLVAGCR